jgi:hypothetical protein
MAERRCDKCSELIADGARFCPACGDPVTHADRLVATSQEAAQRVRLVCPKCKSQQLFPVDLSKAESSLVCGQCGTSFTSRLLIIRAKRSSKTGERRKFSVRVERFTGGEELIEFVNASTEDFELRSRDIAAFSYQNGALRIVQNMKIGQVWIVSSPKCYVATFVYGADSAEVIALRRWRDEELLSSPLGAWAVRLYYGTSPWLVTQVRGSRLARAYCRLLIAPVLWLIGSHPDEQR